MGLINTFATHKTAFYLFCIIVLVIILLVGINIYDPSSTTSLSPFWKTVMGVLVYIALLNASVASNVIASDIVSASKRDPRNSPKVCAINDATCKNE